MSTFTQLQESLAAARNEYDARHPWTIVPHLATALKTTRSLIEKVQSIDLDNATRAHLLFLLRKIRNTN